MIKQHPNDCTLIKFSEGTLSPSESLLVSAHCDMCSVCLNKVDTFTDNLAFGVFNEKIPSPTIQVALLDMFDEITETSSVNPDSNLAVNSNRNLVNTIQQEIEICRRQQCNDGKILSLDGRQFELPKSLRKYNSRVSEWTKLVGKIWQLQVAIGGGYLAQFIYMEKGGSVPEHTHKGNEYTLVIDGEFSDGLNNYEKGDFIALNAHHKHLPVTDHKEGCLVFSIIDEPLHFTSGWAKLVNPLSQLYFQVNSRM